MNNTISLAILLTITTITLMFCSKKTEGFTATGWVYNRPSEWWFPQKYNVADWLTPYYPDQLSQPTCLSYNRGYSPNLNYNSSAYRFWKF